MATRKRHTPEQIVRKLAAADRLLAEGKDVADVCRQLQVTEAPYYRWRNQFGGLKADDAKRLKDLEKENSTLKRLLADAELEKAALKEIARRTLAQRLRRVLQQPHPRRVPKHQHLLVPGPRQGRHHRLEGGLQPPPTTLDQFLGSVQDQ